MYQYAFAVLEKTFGNVTDCHRVAGTQQNRFQPTHVLAPGFHL